MRKRQLMASTSASSGPDLAGLLRLQVPSSAMAEHFPALWPQLEYGGAKQFLVDDDGTPIIRDDFMTPESVVHR